jgi:hypothetical protein
MKIGILIVCTGKYVIFFEDLYKSCEKYFLPDYEKTYFVFTDGNILDNHNIVRIEQPVLGFPFDTLMRYEMFTKHKEKLQTQDYLFFLNANLQCVDYIGNEIIPKEEHQYLMAVQHPGFADRPINEYTYERNPNSNFYIPYDKGVYYYQGNFNGGRSKEFLEMSEILIELIKDDVSKGIIPVWWDESAMNWYLLDKTPLMTSTQYAAPEGWGISNMKIMSRDKNKYGGHDSLRSFK